MIEDDDEDDNLSHDEEKTYPLIDWREIIRKSHEEPLEGLLYDEEGNLFPELSSTTKLTEQIKALKEAGSALDLALDQAQSVLINQDGSAPIEWRNARSNWRKLTGDW